MKYSTTDRAIHRARKSVARQMIDYDAKSLAPIPMMRLPGTSKPSAWNAAVGWIFELRYRAWPDHGYLAGRLEAGKPIDDQLRQIEHLMDAPVFSSMRDYGRVFTPTSLPKPASLSAIQRPDDWFEWSRVAGLNPTVLRRVVEPTVLARFGLPLTTPLTVPSANGATLEALLDEGRLFYVDHRWLSGITQQPLVGGGKKFAPPTIGLFHADSAGVLRALAIYLPHGQNQPPIGAGGADVYWCDGSPAWTMARTYFESADLNYHEIVTHLVYTHFCLEAVVVATLRSFTLSHPIGALLDQHLANVLFNNYEGRMLLINDGGFASKLLFGGTVGSKELIALAYTGDSIDRGYSIDTWDLPEDLALRGVDSTSKLVEYPFRDDGLAVWGALARFVKAFVAACYDTPAAANTDRQLRRWLDELESGAKIPGLAALYARLGCKDPRDKLEAVLHRIIWASGPLHSAVNFSQYDHAAFTPAMPGAMLAPPLPAAEGTSAAAMDAFLRGVALPKPESTLLQLQTVSLLTAYRFDQLGHYESSFERKLSPKAKAAVAAFRTDLARVESTIVATNPSRRFEYPYLRPSKILNAASI